MLNRSYYAQQQHHTDVPSQHMVEVSIGMSVSVPYFGVLINTEGNTQFLVVQINFASKYYSISFQIKAVFIPCLIQNHSSTIKHLEANQTMIDQLSHQCFALLFGFFPHFPLQMSLFFFRTKKNNLFFISVSDCSIYCSN